MRTKREILDELKHLLDSKDRAKEFAQEQIEGCELDIKQLHELVNAKDKELGRLRHEAEELRKAIDIERRAFKRLVDINNGEALHKAIQGLNL